VSQPGWFRDAQNPAFVRWWNGSAWTEHTRPAEPVAAPAAPFAPQGPPSAPNPFMPQGPPPSSPNPFMGGPASAPFVPQPQGGAPYGQHPIDQHVRDAEARLVDLRRQLESVEESLELQSFGFYRPKYGFDSSEKYTARLKQLREEQKRLIKAGLATHCDTAWHVGGSVAEGKKMIDRMSKLMLRAFNGECDAAIAKARYDNVVALEERVTKSCKEINLLGHSNRVMITTPYYQAKLAELHLVHEHREKVQEEKEEQKRIREQLKEEQKAREEIEKAQADAEREEEKKTKALEKAQADLAAAVGTAEQTAKLAALVARLETELKGALEVKAKAIARAQMTKSGHVYVLSNHGSFGEGIYKIGLTRRLDPYERVEELGDASVPFSFDVHAIIFAQDAPKLENALHKEFAHRRVNMVNHRKEYFRVTLDDIRVAVEKHHGLVTFVLTPEAEEWRKTRALLEAQPS
jgi:hypothetical protein